MFVTDGTAGAVPVTVNTVPAAGAGEVTVIVPVGTAQVASVFENAGADGGIVLKVAPS